jgi:hypothetical protein
MLRRHADGRGKTVKKMKKNNARLRMLVADKTGHFYFGKNTTFLFGVDNPY